MSSPRGVKKSIDKAAEKEQNLQRVAISEYVAIPENGASPTSFPCLASFRGCTKRGDPEALELKLRKQGRINETKGNDEEDHTARLELVAQSKDGREQWLGRNSYHDIDSSYCIGIRNKVTGKMKVIQVGKMYSMRPYVDPNRRTTTRNEADGDTEMKDSDEEYANDGDGDDDEKRDLSVQERQRNMYMKKRMELLNAFGGKKALTAINKYQRDAITDNKIGEHTLTQINEAAKRMKTADLRQGIDINADETTETLAPPHDKTATTPSEAYPIEGFITPRELAALIESVELLIDFATTSSTGESGASPSKIKIHELENPGWHLLVWRVLMRQLSEISPIEEPSLTMKKQMCCAMHLHYLITIAQANRILNVATRNKLSDDMGVPENILSILTERFFEQQREYGREEVRVKSVRTNNILVQHAILMWLHAHDFRSCGLLDTLADALNVNPKGLMVQATELGCKVRKLKTEEGIGAIRLTLPVPLAFPAIKTSKRSRKSKKSVL